MTEFLPWPKIPRGGNNNVVITEKIDGTNACIVIEGGEVVAVQSRKRFIKVGDDNYGFASWVEENKEALSALGDGHHFGEWAGEGIQGNPMALDGKYLYLFNTFRFGEHNPLPDIVRLVPVLFKGPRSSTCVEDAMISLKEDRAYLPEGIIVYDCVSRAHTKYTYKFSRGKWDKE